jgi:streptogramin lyase
MVPASPSPSPTNPAYAITEYPLPANADGAEIVSGPDGNLWFTVPSGARIGKITTSGVVTLYNLPPPADPDISLWGIVEGPDGNLWFTAGAFIGKITTAGVVTEYPLPAGSAAEGGIVTGLDRNLWLTDTSGFVDKMTITGAVTQYPVPGPSSDPMGIVSGPDGRVWFSAYGFEVNVGAIGALMTSGAMVEYPVPAAFTEFIPPV